MHFFGCRRLKEIDIPESVTYIGAYAFSSCEDLLNVKIPTKLTSIERAVFLGCSSLQSIEIPQTVTNIGSYAFSECNSIKKIEISSNVESIEGYAFANCSSLESIIVASNNENYMSENGVLFNKSRTRILSYPAEKKDKEEYSIPSGVTSIAESAFEGTSLKYIKIPTTVESIGHMAFKDASNLQRIEIPKEVIYIGQNVFDYCYKLIIYVKADSEGHRWAEENGEGYVLDGEATKVSTNYELKDEKTWDVSAQGDGSAIAKWTLKDRTLTISGIGEISNSEFNLKDKIYTELVEKVSIVEGIEGIGKEFFNRYFSLISIELPEGLISISNKAFLDCYKLVSINIPKTVVNIGGSAFDNCYGLVSINVNTDNKNYLSEDGILFNKEKTTLIKYPSKKDDIKEYSIPTGVTGIVGGAFERCEELESIEISEGVKWIGSNAFEGCKGLKSIEIPEGVTSIERETFLLCEGLKNITIPSSVSSIAMRAFNCCINLESINIPKGVTSIERETFTACYNLTKIVIPDSVESIKESAFSICYNLGNMSISDNVRKIENSAFAQSNVIIYTTPNSEVHKYAENNKIGYVIDEISPILKIDYSNENLTKENVLVTITANEEVQEVEGWELSEDKKVLTKEYDENARETITIRDLAGNETEASIEINNIDKTEPDVQVEYSTKEITRDNVLVTITANEEVQEVEGWKLSEDKKMLTKEYSANTKETITIKDLAGNETKANIEINNIDKTAPRGTIEYSTKEPTNKNVIVTITSNEEIQEVEGWALSSNRKVLTKEYNENTKETITVKDLAGNETQVNIEVNNIEETTIGDINQDEKIDVTDLLMLKRHLVAGSRESWKLTGDSLLVADMNEDGNVDITDMLILKRKIVNNI